MAKGQPAKVSKAGIAAIHEGLKKAGLENYRLTSLHLIPRRSVGAAAVDDDGPCHAVELPNGHIFVSCGN